MPKSMKKLLISFWLFGNFNEIYAIIAAGRQFGSKRGNLTGLESVSLL